MRSLKKWRVALLFSIAFLSPVCALTGPKFVVTGKQVTQLPMPAGLVDQASWAMDINNGGDIAGALRVGTDQQSDQSPFISLNGQTYSLFPPGDWPHHYSAAYGINDSRVIVGAYSDANFRRRPFYYYPGIWFTPMKSLPLHTGNDWEAEAYAVNNAGTAVGGTEVVGSLFPDVGCGKRPVRWVPYTGNPTGLPCIADPIGTFDPVAYDINDSGDIVGTDGGVTQFSMFLRKSGVMVAVPPPAGMAQVDGDGDALKGVAYGINNQGVVVGAYGYPESDQAFPDLGTGVRAYIWDGISSTSQSLGTLPNGGASVAREINEQRMVAGTSTRTYTDISFDPSTYVAFIWHEDFGMVALPALSHSWHLNEYGWWTAVPRQCEATAINNRNSKGLVQVVGSCYGPDHYPHAVRWDITVQVLAPLPQL